MKAGQSWTAVLFLAALAVGMSVFLYGLLPKYLSVGMVRPGPLSARHVSQRAVPAPRTGQEQDAARSPLLPQLTAFIAGAEPTVNRVLDNQHWFIQLYGGAQRLAGRTVVDDHANAQYTVVRFDNGMLGFTSTAQTDTDKFALNLRRFAHVLDERGIPLLYIQAPTKLEPGSEDTALPYGMDDSGNTTADALLARLADLGVETMDLRTVLAQSGRPWSDWFYRTDHHWTPEAAFYSYLALCERLEQYNHVEKTQSGVRTTHYTIPARYRDASQFTVDTLDDFFLGSQGKRVGSLYAGADDFTLWKPRFTTWFEHTVPVHSIAREGRFEDSLLFPERVAQRDWFNGNPYTYYSGGDFPIAYMKNMLDPTGPRVMLMRDSFACVLQPFLALACSELIIIDPRHFKEDYMLYVDWLKPDIILVMYTTGSVRLPGMFDFLTKPSNRIPFPQSKLLPPAPTLAPALKSPPPALKEDWQK